MTTTAAAPALPATRLRALLLVDGVGTALLGVVALVAAEPLADEVGTPLVLRSAGVLFLLIGGEMLLVRRTTGDRLRAGARMLGGVDLGFAGVCLTALVLVEASATGAALLVALATVCVVMGAAKLLLARR